MFTQNIYEPTLLSNYHIDNEYFLLYYQLIKNAFGLKYCNNKQEEVSIQLLLDDMPDKPVKVKKFKSYLCGISDLSAFKDANIKIIPEGIAEVKSHNHSILQGLDIILGAMQFRLNDMHKEKPDGQRLRGKRTRAKEGVYKHINKRIRELRPGFNIGVTTAHPNGPQDYWNQPYRHWNFVPSNHKLDLRRGKKGPVMAT